MYFISVIDPNAALSIVLNNHVIMVACQFSKGCQLIILRNANWIKYLPVKC